MIKQLAILNSLYIIDLNYEPDIEESSHGNQI